MTKVTYLDHSAFAVSVKDAILVFDYTTDPGRHLRHLMEQQPEAEVIFFVTHHHADHFNQSIFELAQSRRHAYVLSNDIDSKLVPDKGLQVAWMSKGDVIEQIPGIKSVEAFGSTDKGVSYVITADDGTTIFHAGDLNDWSGFADDAKEAHKDVEAFRVIVDRIAEKYPSIDVAMFPVDARLGDSATAGAEYFLNRIKVADFFPMHFNGAPEKSCDFAAYVPSRTKAFCLTSPGKSVEV